MGHFKEKKLFFGFYKSEQEEENCVIVKNIISC